MIDFVRFYFEYDFISSIGLQNGLTNPETLIKVKIPISD